MADRITSYEKLKVYQNAMESAMEIFQITKTFPLDEKYSLINQIRRSSRSVCANIAEGWRKRRYQAAFISKLSDAESEACETQVWLEFAFKCDYIDADTKCRMNDKYNFIIGQLVKMIDNSEKWLILK